MGEGEPLVLISGNMQAAEDWVRWGYPELLADRFRLIIIDLLGYGESDKPHTTSSYTLAAVRWHFDAVLDAEGSTPRTCGATRSDQRWPNRSRPASGRITWLVVIGGTLPGLTGADGGTFGRRSSTCTDPATGIAWMRCNRALSATQGAVGVTTK